MAKFSKRHKNIMEQLRVCPVCGLELKYFEHEGEFEEHSHKVCPDYHIGFQWKENDKDELYLEALPDVLFGWE